MPQLDPKRTPSFGLWRYGNDFGIAANLVAGIENPRRFMPYYMLAAQSIELLLKAFLLSRGVPLSDLKGSFGHDLTKLLDRSMDEGLEAFVAITGAECGAIDILSVEYKERRFMYIQTGPLMLPELSIIHGFLEKLSQGIEHVCFEATSNDI
jgi:hypothetical protein